MDSIRIRIIERNRTGENLGFGLLLIVGLVIPGLMLAGIL